MKLKMGTRRSLLAMAQSTQVANLIKAAHFSVNPKIPLEIEIVGIDTRGDKIQDIPLSDVEGKEFFVAELDDALRTEKVDFTVHSLKDLSLTRPADFTCAAIPERQLPHDILIWNWPKNGLEKTTKLRIGTSAPRRIENLPPFLSKLLSQNENIPTIELHSIRGNVNTRLKRLTLPDHDTKRLDGVVLALAGLNRLCLDLDAAKEIGAILQNISQLRVMILPLSLCPSAPAQGALAVECRTSDHTTRSLIGQIHHPKTESLVRLEREVLAEWGGGCHQPVGATAIDHPEFNEPLLFVRGRKMGKVIQEIRWEKSRHHSAKQAIDPHLGDNIRTFDGMRDVLIHRHSIPCSNFLAPSEGVYFTHSRAFDHLNLHDQALVARKFLFCSGTSSWIRLAQKGLWVSGCTDGLGEVYLDALLSSPFLNLAGMPKPEKWVALTHNSALQESPTFSVRQLPCYQVEYSSEIPEKLKNADIIFWGSGTQFSHLHKFAKQNAIHCCGPGRSAEKIRYLGKNLGIKPLVFPNREEWLQWTQK